MSIFNSKGTSSVFGKLSAQSGTKYEDVESTAINIIITEARTVKNIVLTFIDCILRHHTTIIGYFYIIYKITRIFYRNQTSACSDSYAINHSACRRNENRQQNLKNASVSVGIEDHDLSDTGGKRTDYSFRYSQRLFNNRFQIVIGGKVSTGENATNDAESFIDNISLEYRLDRTGTRYVRLFYDKNYESVLEGEITETGVGLVLRKKLDKLSELFIFKKKK